MTNNHYKMLVADIDGTLLNRKGTISTEDTEALARVLNSGIRVALSTGRVAQACHKILNQLSLDGYHIFSDGALVSNPETGDEVYVEPITTEMVKQMADFVHREEMNLDLYSASHFFVERENWTTDIRRKFFGLEPTVIDFSQLLQHERIIKGTLVVQSADEKARANRFYQHFKSNLNFSWTRTPAYPDIDFINVIAHDVSKGKALEALTSFLGITLAEVIAIGDGTNDISLLSRAGLAIAMGTAPEGLRAVADHVTLDVDHNGLSAAVDRFLY